MRGVAIIMNLVMVACMHAATPFHTPRIEKIARALNLQLSESIAPNTCKDSIAFFNGKEIHLRTNGFCDIEHVGYNMFPQALRDAHNNHPVFDFLERYLLELDLQLFDQPMAVRMDVDQVTVVEGKIKMLRQLSPSTDIQFHLDAMPRKMYRVSCEFDNKKVVVTIPSTNELLMGANMLELKDIFKRDVQRMLSISDDAIFYDWNKFKVSKGDGVLIIDGGMYMSKMIRGDIYLTDRNRKRELICNKKQPSQSIRNIMLTGIFDRSIPLKMEIDRYDINNDSIEITLQQFIAYCKAEGCQLYFGIKTMSEEQLTGTLFAYNERYAYDHMLSVTVPLSILDGGTEPIRGKAYTYIPLHMVPDRFFNNFQDSNSL